MTQYKPRQRSAISPFFTQRRYLQNSCCWYLHIVTLTLYIKLPEITIFNFFKRITCCFLNIRILQLLQIRQLNGSFLKLLTCEPAYHSAVQWHFLKSAKTITCLEQNYKCQRKGTTKYNPLWCLFPDGFAEIGYRGEVGSLALIW